MHRPVLLTETLNALNLAQGSKVIDATVGGGGHAEAIAKRIGSSGRLLGLDLDQSTLEQVREKLKPYPNVTLVHSSFNKLEEVAEEVGIGQVDAIMFDLGFSSLQLDDPKRGLSFQADGPLDMRLDSQSQTTAWDLINRANVKRLSDIFYAYGELYDAKRLANQIITARGKQSIDSTLELVKVLQLKDPGVKAKVFQALRIAVNDELQALEEALPQAVSVLRSGGRLAVISFHSLEDRIVKNCFRDNHQLNVVTKKPIVPSEEEVKENSRARSAKLRIAEKI